ncbi:MAG: hypothetical protein COA77_08845 [Thaumarchaeota archaeon]|nr:MAG: hypothetical protein COA77_08845 [Nitrososphaerota archaeon]
MGLEGFFVDACVPQGVKELSSEQYLSSIDVLSRDASDDCIFEEAKKRNRIVITKDIGFVIRTLIKNENIILQTFDGKRILLSGITIDENCPSKSPDKRTKYLIKNNEIMIP